MIHVAIVAAIILLMLLAERLGVIALTRSEKGCQWVRSHAILHPNTISLVRMPMGALSMFFWLRGWQDLALLWFAFWMITDISDGTIARNCDLVTEKGKWMDPLSDKLMYFPVLFMFSHWGPVPRFWMVAIILIDSFGQSARLFTQKKAANYFGKVKTALITTLLTLVAFNHFGELPFMTDNFVYLLTLSCAILAFLSVYCKIVPDLWYANSLTVANFLCGWAAIYSACTGHPNRAFLLIFAAQFFDLFDGRLARKFGSTKYGAILDDVADGTSFGLAIGVLIACQIKSNAPALPMAFPVAIMLALLYFGCVIFRLYRFTKPTVELPAGIFQGLPSPAGAMLAGSSVLLFGNNFPLAVGMVLLTSFLMVCNVRYRHFGHQIWPTLPNGMKVVCFILILIFLSMCMSDKKNYAGLFQLFCFSMAWLYVLYGRDSIACCNKLTPNK
jgi:CDP-diacylglycerol--serine O-phosphatidyltransferase